MIKHFNFETFFILLILSFLALYVTTFTSYQENINYKQSILTDEAIKRFENDVSNGKEIIASNYLKKELNYNNKISKFVLNLSNLIEKYFKILIRFLFTKISNVMNE